MRTKRSHEEVVSIDILKPAIKIPLLMSFSPLGIQLKLQAQLGITEPRYLERCTNSTSCSFITTGQMTTGFFKSIVISLVLDTRVQEG